MNRQSKALIALAAIAALLATACEKVLDIDETPSQLILNGLPTAGQRAFVYFANTRFFLDGSNNHPVVGVTPGDVTLRVNGTPLMPDSVSQCSYFFPHVYAPGDSVSINVRTSQGDVSASTYVPLLPDVSDFGFSRYAGPTFNFMVASFNLHDHADNDEIYRIVVTERDSGLRYNAWTNAYDTIDTISSALFMLPADATDITGNDVCPYIPLGGYLYSTLMFTDRRIDGRDYPVSLLILQTTDTNEVRPFKHEYHVDVSSVTPARFRYILSASQQGGLTSFFAEQGEVLGNVDGALGIFAGTSTRKFQFDTLLLEEGL